MTASLTVNLQADSQLLRSNLSIDVRDSALQLVGTTRSGRSLPLEPGLYRVSAVLEDGREHAEVVSIAEGTNVSVSLGQRERDARAIARREQVAPVADRAVYLEGGQFLDIRWPRGMGLNPEHPQVVRWNAAWSLYSNLMDGLVIRDLSLAPTAPGTVVLSGTLERAGAVPLKNETFKFDATLSDTPDASALRVVDAAVSSPIVAAEPAWRWRRTRALRELSLDGLPIFGNASEDVVLSLPGPYRLSYNEAARRVHVDAFGSPDNLGSILLTTADGEALSPPDAWPGRARDLAVLREAVTSVVGGTVGVLAGVRFPGTVLEGSPIRGLRPTMRDIALSKVSDAVEFASTASEWGFCADGERLGVAEFSGDGNIWSVSLPTFVRAAHEAADVRAGVCDCTVRFRESGAGVMPLALIASWRTVASTVQHMLLEHRYEQAASVAELAKELLMYKYSDPVGATLGALVLHGIGKLREKEDWLKNLALAFRWLPDGRILRAALLLASKDETERNSAFDMLLACVEERALFTESYSLLLTLLRRPRVREDQENRRIAALSTLSERYPCVEWDTLTFTTRRRAE